MNKQKNIKETVKIFDTTLRDGEQSPGFSMTIDEKLMLASQLEKLKVDIIEAGFPISSKGDFKSVQAISKKIKTVTIAGLARAIEGDVDACIESLAAAKKKRVHIFIGTSKSHLAMVNKSKKEAIKMVQKSISLAKSAVDDIEFSAMDSSRTERKFLYDILEAAIDEGATTVNITDTVGYAIPSEFAQMISEIKLNVSNINKAIISVHCHNDLGLAVANSIAAIEAGARQVESAINGIGERAGNAALEEVVMGIHTRADYLKVKTSVNTKELFRSSRLLTAITGTFVQPNKAIVGENAFAHESGIHQDGVLKEPTTFEIIKPSLIGAKESKLILGKHSGRHAFRKRLESLNITLVKSSFEAAFEKFKALADKKKEIFDADIESLINEEISEPINPVWELVSVQSLSGSNITPTATVTLKTADDKLMVDSSMGDGPVDAAFRAIEKITKSIGRLIWYNIRPVTIGKDAMGEATVRVKIKDEIFAGKGSSTDIIEASAKAWLSAVNKQEASKR
ncbi:MAG: 2-isopropylmalate synthase [Nitrospinota bacterium]